jgi:hypothetical protein
MARGKTLGFSERSAISRQRSAKQGKKVKRRKGKRVKKQGAQFVLLTES